MRARKAWMLLLLLAFGGSVETAWTVRQHFHLRRFHFGPAGCRVLGGRFYGPSFAFESEELKEVPAGTAVDVQNVFGGVRVTAGPGGEVRILLKKVVFLPTAERARVFASNLHLSADLQGGALSVGTNRLEVEAREDVGFETHIDLHVPPGTSVRVRNEHGAIDIAGVAETDVESRFGSVKVEKVAGAAKVKSRHGDVTVSGIGATVSLTAQHGGLALRDVAGRAVVQAEFGDVSAVRVGGLDLRLRHGNASAEEVQGDLDFVGEHAAVEARDVSGAVRIETSFRNVGVGKVGGAARIKAQHAGVSARDVKGAVTVATSFDDVTLERIGGAVEAKVEHGGLRASGLENGARVEATGADVAIEGFRGAVIVRARRGSVRLVPDGALTQAVAVDTAGGGIRLEVPVGSRFDLDAETRSGEVELGPIPGLAVTVSSPRRIAGKVGGGGSVVRLRAQHGDVSIGSRAPVAGNTTSE